MAQTAFLTFLIIHAQKIFLAQFLFSALVRRKTSSAKHCVRSFARESATLDFRFDLFAILLVDLPTLGEKFVDDLHIHARRFKLFEDIRINVAVRRSGRGSRTS